MSKRLFLKNRPGLFTPKFRNQKENQNAGYVNTNYYIENNNNLIKNTNFESTSSYRYNNKQGIVSTQEININYSFFENHTFFHSAVAKVNESFDNIINHYPFDGSLKEIESFEDRLTGYEKHILDIFPKNVGYLNFSGSKNLTGGTYIAIKDIEGNLSKGISKNTSGKIILDPKYSSFSAQMFLNVPDQTNDNQIIFQKRKSLAENFTLCLSSSSSTSECEIIFGITSGSNYNVVSSSLEKGSFSHITAQYDKENDHKLKLIIFNNREKKTVVSSSISLEFGNLNYEGNDFKIGTGAECRINNLIFTPIETFSGSIDEFKFYHKAINETDAKENKKYSAYPERKLKLYYKFNEPYGDYNGNNIVLDSSGNSLNASISNFKISNRLTSSFNHISGEDIERSPVLFPNYPAVLSLNTALLSSASLYDDVNPNLITNLVPRHYFDEGNIQDNFTTPIGNISNDFSKLSTVRSNQDAVSSTQLLTKFLLTWAKFFDQIKLYIDNYALFSHVNYTDKNTIADKFLFDLGRKYGITLPTLFSHGNNKQLFYGQNIKESPEKIIRSLFDLQNLIWRNILTNMPHIMKKRGTITSIKDLFRSSGIEIENLFKIREYGGAKIKSLENSKEVKKDVIMFLDFSGSLGHFDESVNSQGISSTSPLIKSKYLSSSRKEIGFPLIRGDYVNKNNIDLHGTSNNLSDGLLTSGSFSFQGTYKFPTNITHANKQSLVRIQTTGTLEPSLNQSSLINLVANKEQQRIDMFFVADPTTTIVSQLHLTGVNIFDGNHWAISFGRADSSRINSKDKSLFFVRAGRFNAGKKIEMFTTASYFDDSETSALTTISEYNTSGSFITIGSQSLNPGSSIGKFLNNGSDTQKTTIFTGRVSSINFWSKFNTITDFERYGKDILTFGSKNPLKNYNHNYLETGSYGRLRLQTFAKQATTGSDSSGNIRIFDNSQNIFHLDGTGFETNKLVMKPSYFIREMLDYDFDLNTTNEKIRIRSFNNINRAKQYQYATTTPVYEVRKSEEVFDDTRLSIDLSVMKGLNENIMRMFSNFNFFDNALGKPNILFSDRYKDLIALRKMFFNDVLEHINLGKYRGLFKWIDNAYTDLVFSLIPRTTNFLGINFIYESHVLERHRLKYMYDNMYAKALPTSNQEIINREESYEVPVDNSTSESPREEPTQTEDIIVSVPIPNDESEDRPFVEHENPGEPHRIPRGERDPCQIIQNDIQILTRRYVSGDVTKEYYDEELARLNARYEEVCKSRTTPGEQRIGKDEQKEEVTEKKDNSDSSNIDKQTDAPTETVDPNEKIDPEERKQEETHREDQEKHEEEDIPPDEEELLKQNKEPEGDGLAETEKREEEKREEEKIEGLPETESIPPPGIPNSGEGMGDYTDPIEGSADGIPVDGPYENAREEETYEAVGGDTAAGKLSADSQSGSSLVNGTSGVGSWTIPPLG